MNKKQKSKGKNKTTNPKIITEPVSNEVSDVDCTLYENPLPSPAFVSSCDSERNGTKPLSLVERKVNLEKKETRKNSVLNDKDAIEHLKTCANLIAMKLADKSDDNQMAHSKIFQENLPSEELKKISLPFNQLDESKTLEFYLSSKYFRDFEATPVSAENQTKNTHQEHETKFSPTYMLNYADTYIPDGNQANETNKLNVDLSSTSSIFIYPDTLHSDEKEIENIQFENAAKESSSSEVLMQNSFPDILSDVECTSYENSFDESKLEFYVPSIDFGNSEAIPQSVKNQTENAHQEPEISSIFMLNYTGTNISEENQANKTNKLKVDLSSTSSIFLCASKETENAQFENENLKFEKPFLVLDDSFAQPDNESLQIENEYILFENAGTEIENAGLQFQTTDTQYVNVGNQNETEANKFENLLQQFTCLDAQFENSIAQSVYFDIQLKNFDNIFEKLLKKIKNSNANTNSCAGKDVNKPNRNIGLNLQPIINIVKFYKELWEELMTPFSFHECLWACVQSENKNKNGKSISSKHSTALKKDGEICDGSSDFPNHEEKTNLQTIFRNTQMSKNEIKVIRCYEWMYDVNVQMQKALDDLSKKTKETLRLVFTSQDEFLDSVRRMVVLNHFNKELQDKHRSFCETFEKPVSKDVISNDNQIIETQLMALNKKVLFIKLYWTFLKKFNEQFTVLLNKRRALPLIRKNM